MIVPRVAISCLFTGLLIPPIATSSPYAAGSLVLLPNDMGTDPLSNTITYCTKSKVCVQGLNIQLNGIIKENLDWFMFRSDYERVKGVFWWILFGKKIYKCFWNHTSNYLHSSKKSASAQIFYKHKCFLQNISKQNLSVSRVELCWNGSMQTPTNRKALILLSGKMLKSRKQSGGAPTSGQTATPILKYHQVVPIYLVYPIKWS